jgi:hypothetical protein
LPKMLSPSAQHGCSRTSLPLVSVTADRVTGNAHHSLARCDYPPIASEGNDFSLALSSIQSPQNANLSKSSVKLLPSPGLGTDMKKSYLESAIPRDHCSSSKPDLPCCHGGTYNARITTILDAIRIQDNVQNFIFAGLPNNR